jgi:hypothetical protein
MATAKKKPTDWRKRFHAAKPPHNVVLHTDFAGVKAGTVMFISSPAVVAEYLAAIPAGETRSIERLRNELARKNGAQVTCPVTTAIYLRVVAEVALKDMAEGKVAGETIPFWRVIDPESKIAAKLSCTAEDIAHLRAMDGVAAE